MNFYVHHNHADDEDVKFSTETRIYVHDQITRKKFARYWLVIHSFSAFNRKMLLRAVKRHLETTVIIWRKSTIPVLDMRQSITAVEDIDQPNESNICNPSFDFKQNKLFLVASHPFVAMA